MRGAIFLALVGLRAVALAQAPVEERGVAANLSLDAQQRVEFARRAAEQADSGLKTAESDVHRAESALESAQKQHDEAKSRLERARRSLDQARAKAKESHATYERESSQFDLHRRGAP
ncbi:MAG TPA: hypothetical protein VEF92_05455 [Burkholderiales bacterium]|nr:hypothetical protein [Burkholderiales bacterium]